MNNKAIIFDMDGVIFDTERVYMNIWIEVYTKYGYKMNREIYTTFIGRDRNSITKMLYNLYGESFEAKKIFEECDRKLKEAIDNGKVPVKEGALELFDFLKLKGYKMALATSSPKEKLEMQLKIHNLQDVFDCIICADDVKESKPNPEIFLCSARKLNADVEECIVIEDSPAGIEAAYNAGISAFHVEDLVKANDNIINHSSKQFKDLLEVKKFIESFL
ncbi:MAG: HAD family phosphatase [Clostridium sp.]|nr:HAD family phosphatase [Clostridium sp.]